MVNKKQYKSLERKAKELVDRYDAKELGVFQSQLRSRIRMRNRQVYADAEQHLTWSIADTAYELILAHNLCAKDALILAAKRHEADIERVLGEKSRKTGKMSGSIVKANDEHPVQVDMQKRGKFNRQSLKNANNVWQLLNLLKDFRQAYEELLTLEERVDSLEDEQIILKAEVELLKENTGIEGLSDADKAKVLRDSGRTLKQVAEYLGVTERTIKRWTNGT